MCVIDSPYASSKISEGSLLALRPSHEAKIIKKLSSTWVRHITVNQTLLGNGQSTWTVRGIKRCSTDNPGIDPSILAIAVQHMTLTLIDI